MASVPFGLEVIAPSLSLGCTDTADSLHMGWHVDVIILTYRRCEHYYYYFSKPEAEKNVFKNIGARLDKALKKCRSTLELINKLIKVRFFQPD